MALFKISKGQAANLPTKYNEGWCYFTTDDGKFYIDTSGTGGTTGTRIAINANNADHVAWSGITNIPTLVYSVATGSTNGTISVNQGGTTSNVAVKGLAAAAYKGVTDNSSAAAVSTSDTNLITGRTLANAGYVKTSGVTSITLKAGDGISLDTDNTAITSTGTRTITNAGVRSVSTENLTNNLSVNTGGTTSQVPIYVDSTHIVPLISKTYDSYTVSANDANNGILFFGTVSIDNTTNYYQSWGVKYRLTVTTTENATQGIYDCSFWVNGSTIDYYNYNNFYSTSYRPIYNHGLLYPKDGKSSNGAHLGMRVYSSRTPTSLARIYKVEILETYGCTVTLKDNLTKYSALYNSTNFYYGEYNATSQGLQESGDADSGQWYLRYYSLKAESAIVAGNIIVGTDAGYKHLKLGTAFDTRYPVLYAASAISAASTGSNNYIFHYAIGIATTQSLTLTAHKPLYIKGTLSGTIFTPISTTPVVQEIDENENDNYFYYYIGRAYDTASFTFDTTSRAIFLYKNGTIQQYAGFTSTDGVRAITKPTNTNGVINVNTNGTSADMTVYSLPTASSSVLGGVKVGSNLSISNGVLSGKAGTVTSITLTQGDGITISNSGTEITTSGSRTISNAGVRSISTGSTNGTISVNTGGTTADVAVYGLGDRAFDSTAYLPLAGGTMTGQIQKASSGTSWYTGRDKALVRNTATAFSNNQYNAILSVKSIDGTWDIGTYTVNNSLYFSYITDANYNNNSNTTSAQIEFRGSDKKIYATGFVGDVTGTASGNLTNVAWDSTNSRFTRTKNGTTESIITIATLKTALGLGSAAYTASTDYATSGHKHTTSIATSNGTSSLTLAFGSKYSLTAGGNSYIFTMPSNPNTNTTYTIAPGDSNGYIKITPSAGTAYSVLVTGGPFLPLAGGTVTGETTFNDAVLINDELSADSASIGNLLVTGAANFTNGITGNLTGSVTGTASGNLTNVKFESNLFKKTINGTTSTIATWGVGTLPTLTTDSIACDDITAWSAGTAASATYSQGVLTFTNGTAPSLSYNGKTVNSVSSWSTGTLPSLT